MASIFRHKSGWRVQVQRRGTRVSQIFKTEEEARQWAGETEELLAPAAARHKALANPDLVKVIPPKVLKAMKEVEFSLAEILAMGRPAPETPGVYFLIREGVVVYIGKTRSLMARLTKHRNNGKVFDAYTFLPCALEDLAKTEALYIMAYWPLENLAVELSEDE
jgi:hypothetical protein